MATLDQLRERYGRELLAGVHDCSSCVRSFGVLATYVRGAICWCSASPDEALETCWRSCRDQLARLERERMGR